MAKETSKLDGYNKYAGYRGRMPEDEIFINEVVSLNFNEATPRNGSHGFLAIGGSIVTVTNSMTHSETWHHLINSLVICAYDNSTINLTAKGQSLTIVHLYDNAKVNVSRESTAKVIIYNYKKITEVQHSDGSLVLERPDEFQPSKFHIYSGTIYHDLDWISYLFQHGYYYY